jgi:hypothetical protein
MTRLSPFRIAALGTLAAGVLGIAAPTFAAPADNPDASTLLAKADHHLTMAEDYRARMRTDPKHAISWFTIANHCDQEAQAFRTAALQVSGERSYRR